MQARRRSERFTRNYSLLCLTIVALVMAGFSQPLRSAAASSNVASRDSDARTARTVEVPLQSPPFQSGRPDTVLPENTPRADSPLIVSGLELVSDDPLDSQVLDALRGTVVVGWGGQVTAVWYRGRLFASKRAHDGTWSEPVPVSEPFNINFATFDVAAGAVDDVSVAWSARAGGRLLVFETHFDNGRWTVPHVLGRGRDPEIAMDGRGRASVVWSRQGNLVRSRNATGRWSPTRRYPGPKYSYRVDIAANRAGDHAAISNGPRFGDNARVLYRGRRSPRWPAAAEAIPATHLGSWFGPAIAVAPNGSALAAWAVGAGIGWTHRDRDAGWSRLRTITKNAGMIGEYGNVELTYNRRGEALALWQAENGSFASRYVPGRGFGHATRLTGEIGFFRAVGTPMLSSDGTAVVVGTSSAEASRNGVSIRWQEPGQAWSRLVPLNGAVGVRAGTAIAGAAENRMAVFFSNSSLTVSPSEHGLYAVIIDRR